MKSLQLVLAYFLIIISTGCNSDDRIPVIFDTDANNELDDQHALAYLLLNDTTFNLKGITVNTTYNGGNIEEHFKEAYRILQLCELENDIPLFRGANESFSEILDNIRTTNFDGHSAVNFIIEEAIKHKENKLILLAVGKLTNVALALEKAPAIANNIKVVWLGSNYPESGEYNLENDVPALNYILQSNVAFEMVMVRYGDPTGTDAVKVTREEVFNNLKGLGPKLKYPVIGRHGGEFNTFGDYAVSLFENADMYGDPPSRSLFDMAAVAIVKNPSWASSKLIAAPKYQDSVWIDQPNNQRKVTLWENFNKKEILEDFYNTISKAN